MNVFMALPDGTQSEPIQYSEALAAQQRGEYPPGTTYWAAGMESWRPIEELAGQSRQAAGQVAPSQASMSAAYPNGTGSQATIHASGLGAGQYQSAPSPAAGGSTGKWIAVGVIAVVAVMIGGAVLMGLVSSRPGGASSPVFSSPLSPASDCATNGTVTYSSSAITVDTRSEYGDLDGLVCVLNALNASDALVTRMENTNALMGWQEATENGLHYGWSYHPDNGMLLSVSQA